MLLCWCEFSIKVPGRAEGDKHSADPESLRSVVRFSSSPIKRTNEYFMLIFLHWRNGAGNSRWFKPVGHLMDGKEGAQGGRRGICVKKLLFSEMLQEFYDCLERVGSVSRVLMAKISSVSLVTSFRLNDGVYCEGAIGDLLQIFTIWIWQMATFCHWKGRCYNRMPEAGVYFFIVWESRKSENRCCFGPWWGLSLWFADGHFLAVSSSWPFSVIDAQREVGEGKRGK